MSNRRAIKYNLNNAGALRKRASVARELHGTCKKFLPGYKFVVLAANSG